jgi:retinol-binding protein 3
MNNKLRFLMPATVLTGMLLFPVFSFTQVRPEQTDLPINAATRTVVIEAVLRRLNDSYVFPEVAAQMERAIRARLQRAEYDRVSSSAALAQTLTSHLREVNNDRHLEVSYRYEPIPVSAGRGEPTPEQLERARRFAVSVNFGFERIDRLEGNIGYLRIDGFIPADVGGETAAAAMNFLAHTDALIFDLRESAGGGDPSMIVFLSSYLFGSEPVHLNDLYWRERNRTQQYWTLSYVPGRRHVGNPVYILTSRRTFSAGEELAYNLQALRRATVIGETTGGGANPGEEFRINEHFEMFVPTGRAINPVTRTNWEGTGVKPDIEVPEAQALKTAHLAALRRLLEGATEERSRGRLRSVIERVERQP